MSRVTAYDTMLAEVRLWGTTIGVVALERGASVATFQYDPAFTRSGIEVAPLTMPLSERVYSFPSLSAETFHGLPGMLADALPDKFGNAVIDAWLATQGRAAGSFNAIERLCYTGSRGMGALEFVPGIGPRRAASVSIRVNALAALAADILNKRHQSHATLANAGRDRKAALLDILRIGTSAGGARAKAVIAWNRDTGEVRSGQTDVDTGFEHWLIKFDGVAGNKDKELGDPKGYGAIEYAYSLMAGAAGVRMSECRLMEAGGRRHFMTRRFDRPAGGGKRHMQTLGALAHFDFNQAGAHSYEQALFVARRLALPMTSIEELFRRMLFNVVARNQDDHVKNIAFLMDRDGRWSLAPAYDVIYSYQPDGAWTSLHQMSVNGKRDNFTVSDFRMCARSALMKRGRAEALLTEVMDAVKRWPEFATRAGVPVAQTRQIKQALRLKFPR
ncbi:MAG: type II toxin-antitoxin system HipA family toxin [Verrucomicrobiales bacterium]|jgi:serine/threonine-protein kinase HipA|nr:type II toxin-antitoxin system HipA family toxin [Verrucomicrobiales bacterium]